MRRRADKPVAVYGALAANVAIAGMKFFVAALSGSSAILSEAIHSSVDTVNELLLLLAIRRARRPPTSLHPFGHAKEVYFWGFVVAVVVFAGGGLVAIYDGIGQLRNPRPTHAFGWKLATLGIAFVFEGGSFLLGSSALRRKERESLYAAVHRSKDPAVYTVVVEDIAALAGLMVAIVGVASSHVFNAPRLDGGASIGIGAILGAAAFVLGAESQALLLGESASPRLIASVRSIADNDRAVRSAGTLLTMQLGPNEVLVNLTVDFGPDLSGKDVAEAIHRIELAIREENPDVGRVFVEPRALRADDSR